MGYTLAELRAASTELLAQFDAALVPPGELSSTLTDAGAVEKMMATLCSLVAAQMGARGPKATSARQAARDLAHAAGTSVPEASRAMAAAKAVRSQPEVEAAARAGDLSRQQLAIIAGAANDNPAAVPRLLELARTGSLQELADEAARARAIGRDFDERRRALRASRYLRQWTDAEGAWNIRARGLPEDGAKVMAAIRPFSERAFEAARAEGRREGPEAYAYDGMVELASAGGAQASRTEILVRVDHSVILRGYAEDGEVCEVAGFGPVSAQAVYDIMDTADPFLKAVVTKGKDVVGVTHLGRRPNTYQQTALDWLFPTCAAEGCGTRADFLQTDHRVDWADTHVTVLELLDRLCRFHHGLKTNQGWRLVEGRGKRAFVRPDDLRHPCHAPPKVRPGGEAGRGAPRPPNPEGSSGSAQCCSEQPPVPSAGPPAPYAAPTFARLDPFGTSVAADSTPRPSVDSCDTRPRIPTCSSEPTPPMPTSSERDAPTEAAKAGTSTPTQRIRTASAPPRPDNTTQDLGFFLPATLRPNEPRNCHASGPPYTHSPSRQHPPASAVLRSPKAAPSSPNSGVAPPLLPEGGEP